MATSAISPRLLALYLADPDAVSTVFTDQELVDAGAHLNYQIAWANRGWDHDETLVIEKQAGGTGEFVVITTGFTINYLIGKITFTAAQGATDNFQATGKRFAGVQVVGVSAASLEINGDLIDVSEMEDSWETKIKGQTSWKVSSSEWWLCDVADPYAPAHDHLDYLGDADLWVAFYPYNAAATKTRFVGRATLTGIDLKGDLRSAIGETLTITGDGELERETYSA